MNEYVNVVFNKKFNLLNVENIVDNWQNSDVANNASQFPSLAD